jgi:UDP-3-O-[3-hydroxymyristoyl] glucosamine N-acyltransferase
VYQKSDFLKLRKEVTNMKSQLLVIAVRKAVVVWIVGLVLLFSASYASAQIVKNGSFESPDVPYGTWRLFSDPTITQGLEWSGFPINPNDPRCFDISGIPIYGIEIQNHVAGSPHTGDQHVELDSYCSSGMFQDLPTMPGQLYDLSFAYSPRPCVSDNRILVKWGSGKIADLNGYVCPGDTAWEVHDITCLSASVDTTRLQFEDASVSDSIGGYIDSVSVVAHTDTGCVSTTATVDPTATVADDATVGPGAVIEAGAEIDSGASIGAEAVIEADAVISSDTMVEARAAVGERTVVNQESTVMADAEIGSDGNIGKQVTMGSQATIGSSVTVGTEATVGVQGETAETAVVAEGTSLAARSTIWRGVEMGRNVTVGTDAEVGVVPAAEGLVAATTAETVATTVVGDETSLGARSKIWMGANIGPRVIVETGATVGVEAMLAEDVAMGADSTAKDGANIGARVRIGKGASVGVNATVGADTTMGAYSAVGDCAVVPQGTKIKRGDTTTWAGSC